MTRPTGGTHDAALDARLDALFGLARERGLAVDLHVAIPSPATIGP